MSIRSSILTLTFGIGLLFCSNTAVAQAIPDSILERIPMPLLGPNDTIPVPAEVYKDQEILPMQWLEWAIVSAPYSKKALAHKREWTRLRNAVYVTYPYAKKAGYVINDINQKIALMKDERSKTNYIKSRERELKKEFTEPLTNLSIYQGKVLMKLINRQTGNNCYDLIANYKGGFTARFWQTVAFFFSSSLKQPYDPSREDLAIERIVQEVEQMYHY